MKLNIETERLIIRNFKPEDGEDLAEILTDPEVTYFEPYETFSHDQALAEAVKFSESNCFYAVALKDTGKVIGKLYFHDDDYFGRFELGFTFNLAYQGKGYAKESSKALINYAFEHMGARRIIAEADTTNEQSWRLLEALGMRREGTYRQACYKHYTEWDDPLWQDIYFYALLKDNR